MGDEKLGTARIFSRMGHTEATSKVHPCVGTCAFAGNRVTGAAAAIVAGIFIFAVRVPSLGHEAREHPMKRNAVVKAGVDERNKIGDGVGGWPGTVSFTYCSKTDAAFSSKSTKKTAQLLFVCLYPTLRIRLRKGFTLVSPYAASSKVAKMVAVHNSFVGYSQTPEVDHGSLNRGRFGHHDGFSSFCS